MEELGSNWKQSLTDREAILVLISPTYLDCLKSFDLYLPLEEKASILVTAEEGGGCSL